MTDKNDELKKVQDFIYSDEVQENLENINNHLLPINVLEISGMGNQEIKHSNVLAWMFGDNQHQLDYQILSKFLGKVTELEGINADTDKENLKNLRHYAYFPTHERDITIKREWKHIDLFIEDKTNRVAIVIENKVWDSLQDGQLREYEDATGHLRKERDEQGRVTEETKNNWDVYYIFLTPDGRDVKIEQVNINGDDKKQPQKTWLNASYQMIYDVVDLKLKKANQDIPDEAKIILASYNDLLIKEGIVAHEDLKKLCEKIWKDKNSREALDILNKNRPNNTERIAKIIEESLTKGIEGFEYVASQNTKTIFRFTTAVIKKRYKRKNQQDFYYCLEIARNGLWLCLFLKNVEEKFVNKLIDKKIISGKTQKTICDVTIEEWEDIRFKPVEDGENLHKQEHFESKLQEVIKDLQKFQKKLEPVIDFQ